MLYICFFFFSSRRRHTRCSRDWSSDVCSSDLVTARTTTPNAATTAGGIPSQRRGAGVACVTRRIGPVARSEEHTSELQSRLHLVCRLLLEKKKKRYASSRTSDRKRVKSHRQQA